MFSGKGIIHSERPVQSTLDKSGTMELIQFWVNVPAEHKMEDPYYMPLTKNDTPHIKPDQGEGSIGIVTGRFNGLIGPIKTHTPMLVLRLELGKNSRQSIPVPESYNALIYNLDGEMEVGGKTITSKEMVYFNNDSDLIELKSLSASRLIFLAGKPIKEPVATYGPFVMNTNAELNHALKDYNEGKMGSLHENFD
jgi:redox-sensitive bicupin YhaK (pirin superfamily)